MTTKRRVRVISEQGRLVGVFAASPKQPGSAAGAPVAALRVGPGQEEHELEIDWPDEAQGASLTEALHARVKKALRLR